MSDAVLNGRLQHSIMTGWNEADLVGPDGEDWRVPASELAARQHRLGELLAEAGDAYYFAPGHDGWVVGDETVIAYEIVSAGKDFGPWKSAE